MNPTPDRHCEQRLAKLCKAAANLDHFPVRPYLNRLEEQSLFQTSKSAYDLDLNTLRYDLLYRDTVDLVRFRDTLYIDTSVKT